MFEIEFNNTKYTVTEDRIIVDPGSLKNKLQVKAGTSKTLYMLADLAGVGLSPATLMLGGHIQFAEYESDGSSFIANKFSEALDSRCKNWFHINKSDNAKALELKKYVENWISENSSGASNSKTAGKVDDSKQRKALEELLEAGLISKEDYEKQIKNL